MNANTVIENVKKELETIYRHATTSSMERARTWYAQAFEVIAFSSSLLWNENYYKESQEIEELWENEWEAKFQKLGY